MFSNDISIAIQLINRDIGVYGDLIPDFNNLLPRRF